MGHYGNLRECFGRVKEGRFKTHGNIQYFGSGLKRIRDGRMCVTVPLN
jgi:hypothetical protein